MLKFQQQKISFGLGKFKKTKKNFWMDLVSNGGGVSGQVHFSRFFLLLMKKLCLKIGKER